MCNLAITLTPEQEAALASFDEAADLAVSTREQSTQANADAITAQNTADHLKQASVETMGTALERAQAFLDAMLPHRKTTGSSPAVGASKK